MAQLFGSFDAQFSEEATIRLTLTADNCNLNASFFVGEQNTVVWGFGVVIEQNEWDTKLHWSLSLQGVLQQADDARREGDAERATALIAAAYAILDFGYPALPL